MSEHDSSPHPTPKAPRYNALEIEERSKGDVVTPPDPPGTAVLPAVACVVPRIDSIPSIRAGALRALVMADATARFLRLRGQRVYLPVTFDSLGESFSAERTARGLPPQVFLAQIRRELSDIAHSLGIAHDGSAVVPSGRLTLIAAHQRLFLSLKDEDLLHRRQRLTATECSGCHRSLSLLSPGENRCPQCGKSVGWAPTGPWLLDLGKFAEQALSQVKGAAWSPSVKHEQRLVIGRQSGLRVTFKVGNRVLGLYEDVVGFVDRPEYILGMEFLYLRPTHPAVDALLDPFYADDVQAYREKGGSPPAPHQPGEIMRQAAMTGFHAINPVTLEHLPVVVSTLVPPGDDAMSGVPAYRSIDNAVARAYRFRLRAPFGPAGDDGPSMEALCTAPGAYKGQAVRSIRDHVTELLVARGVAQREVRHSLRSSACTSDGDHGPPVPLLSCPACGEVAAPTPFLGTGAVEESQDAWAGGGSQSLSCPRCQSPVTYEPLRLTWRAGLLDPTLELLTRQKEGEGELSLIAFLGERDRSHPFLKARTLALFLRREAPFLEESPFYTARIVGDVPGSSLTLFELVRTWGVDAVRLVLLTASSAPKQATISEAALRGAQRMLARTLKTFERKGAAASTASGHVVTARDAMLYRVTADLERGRFHAAFSVVNDFVHFLARPDVTAEELDRETWHALACCLVPFAPHHAVELSCRLDGEAGGGRSILEAAWPQVPSSLPRENDVEIAVFLEGALCDRFTCPAGSKKEDLGRLALGCEKVRARLAGRRVKWIFSVEDYLVSIVPHSPQEAAAAEQSARRSRPRADAPPPREGRRGNPRERNRPPQRESHRPPSSREPAQPPSSPRENE